MDPWSFLIDLLQMLAAALVLGTLAEQLRQSAILGYLVAGTLVGPNGLEYVDEGAHVAVIAELGAALLLFTIGLEFSLRRLRRLGRVALLGGALQVVVTMAAAAAAARLLGLSPRGAIAVGAMVSLSSTACVVRMLVDRRALDSVYGRNALGILLLQDLAVIPLLLIVVVLSGAEAPIEAGAVVGRLLLLAAGVFGGVFLLVNHVVPRLMNIERWARNRELPILLAIILALGSAAAAHQAGVSPAVGAFIAGVLLGESPFAAQIRADIASLRTLLVTLFFASLGMLGEPAWVLKHWHLVAGTVLLILAGKALIVLGIVRLLGFTAGLAAATGLCVAQVGEFSFVLADTARTPSSPGTPPLISDDTFRLLVSATIATLFLTPFLVAAAPRAADWIESRRRRPAPAAMPAAADGERPAPSIVIVGFGPAGQAVANALYAHHRDRILVIDLSPRNSQAARTLGLAVHLGDATHREVLDHAGIAGARVVAITIPDPDAVRTVIHLCRQAAPDSAVVARARYHVRRWEMELAGAREVIDEEEQVGLRIAASVRRHLGGAEE